MILTVGIFTVGHRAVALLHGFIKKTQKTLKTDWAWRSNAKKEEAREKEEHRLIFRRRDPGDVVKGRCGGRAAKIRLELV